MDYIEKSCCFDNSYWTGSPDCEPTEAKLDVPEIIKELDRLNNQGREQQAQLYLEQWLKTATELGDWRARLSILSELMGHYRKTGEKEKGLAAVNEGLEVIRQHNMGSTLSGATVMLNAATTLKCFGKPEESLEIFKQVCRVYGARLDPHDYRFAGLYNNMALSHGDLGQFKQAEELFKKALSVIRACPKPHNEMAVSYCNLAELYYRQDPEDPRIDRCMEQAWQQLNHPELEQDGYHAFNASKCLPSFDFFGYFLWAAELRERVKRIYEGA